VVAYPFKGRGACPWVRSDEDWFRRHCWWVGLKAVLIFQDLPAFLLVEVVGGVIKADVL